MESGDFKDELNCSICLSLCTDPVSLRCGHFFCRYCIISALDAQEAAGVYSCPDCRAQYPERPACTKSPVPAVKSCLQCESSLCDEHLTAHNKTADHMLTEPTGSLDNKRCSLHKKVLEYFCPHDAACLCVSCRLVSEHQGHKVELLDEASETKKKKLREYLDEPQVLSKCGLSLGRHYWEVEWNQKGICDIGMCYPSIERKGDKSLIGEDDKSWILTLG